MDKTKPRRVGRISEYQNGHWFMYVTEWDETSGKGGRQHTEVEIYHVVTEHIYSSDRDKLGDPLWNTTDPNKLDEAIKAFMDKPEGFADIRIPGELPKRNTEGVTFPVHSWAQYRREGWKDCPTTVPLEMLKPFETQAVDNHSQDLETLARRGGLCPLEMYAIIHGQSYGFLRQNKITLEKAIKFINEKVAEFNGGA